MSTELKVGSTVWLYDSNWENRSLKGEAKFRSGFSKRIIYGETKQSWLVGAVNDETKVRKRDLTYGHWGGGRRDMITSQREIDDLVFVDTHRYKIVKCFEWTRDVALLHEIAELIGYDEETGKAERG